MRSIIISLIVMLLTACTISKSESQKDTSYSLDSINLRTN